MKFQQPARLKQGDKIAIVSPSSGHIQAAPEYTDADLDWADKQNLNKKR